MSGLYIPNIELPTCCAGCHFRDALMCEMGGSVPFNRRLYDCPLIPVPDHGRLIDADALESNLNKMGILVDARVKGFIKSIPTIIPADKDGE